MAETLANSTAHWTARRVIGAVYLVAGLLVLAAQGELITLTWSLVLPTLLVALGAAILLSGLVDAVLAHRHD